MLAKKIGCAQPCKTGMRDESGKTEIRTGKKRQCIAQIPDTPIPKRSQSTDAVILLLGMNKKELVVYISVCINIHTSGKYSN